jgi:mannose-6-phosphate isomerase-like protein (cupin superfamily)
MNLRSLRELPRFSADKMQKVSVFQTERLFYDLYCLEPGQAQKVHSHAASDKVYLVLEGRAAITLGDEEEELGPEQAVLCPAGVPHGARNPGDARAILLVVTTPPPQ